MTITPWIRHPVFSTLNESTIMKKISIARAASTLAIAAATILGASHAHAQQPAPTAEQEWVMEGRVWAVAQLCSGDKGLKASKVASDVLTVRLSNEMPADRGLSIADAAHKELMPAIKKGKIKSLCATAEPHLAGLNKARGRSSVLGKEVGEDLRAHGQTSTGKMDSLVQSVEQGHVHMNGIMGAIVKSI